MRQSSASSGSVGPSAECAPHWEKVKTRIFSPDYLVNSACETHINGSHFFLKIMIRDICYSSYL